MKVVKFRLAEQCEPEPGWLRRSLCNEQEISIEHFVKPPGHTSPLHQHPNAQVLVVLKGSMTVMLEDGREESLEEGDAAYIPPDEPHAVKNPLDTPAVGLDIFIPGRSFDFWYKKMGIQR